MTLTVPAPAPARSAPIRVLFADDSAAMRTLARYSLSAKRGFLLVAEATDGAEALSLYDAHLPDCVVLDVEMPVMGGFEALTELHRRRPALPVVMLSGYADEETTRRATSLGAAAYLEKSGGLVKLADTLKRVTPEPASADEAPPIVRHLAEQVTAAVLPDTVAAEMRRLEYVVSHDFGEPARVMRGFAGLLQSRYADSLDDSGRMFLDQIVGAAGRLQSMLDDLLVHSRAGRATTHLAPVDTARAMTDVCQELQVTIRERHADVRASHLPDVVADAGMLRTVFRELVLNALIFNTSDEPRVTVGGSVVDGGVVVTVGDNGIGVGQEHHEAVFELFRRLNTRDEYPGNGAGLTLCKRLIEMQGGTISLASTDGGTVVSFTLPSPAAQGETS